MTWSFLSGIYCLCEEGILPPCNYVGPRLFLSFLSLTCLFTLNVFVYLNFYSLFVEFYMINSMSGIQLYSNSSELSNTFNFSQINSLGHIKCNTYSCQLEHCRMGLWLTVKCLSSNYEDLSLASQNSSNRLSVVVYSFHPSYSKMRGGDCWVPKSCWATKPDMCEKVPDQSEFMLEDARRLTISLSLTSTCKMCMCAHTCTITHIHTNHNAHKYHTHMHTCTHTAYTHAYSQIASDLLTS